MKPGQYFKLRLIFALWLTLFFSASHASFQKAMELYESKQYDLAFEAFTNMAEIGDVSSMFNIGVMYYRGESVQSDPVFAYAWIKVASELSQQASHQRLAVKIFKALSEQDKKKASREYQKLYSHYNQTALNQRIFPKFLSDDQCAEQPSVIKEVVPKYPRKALRAGKVGSVTLEFMVSKKGYVRDLMIMPASHKEFRQAAIKAMKQFRYKPAVRGGEPVNTYGHKFKFTFNIKGAKLEETVLKHHLKKFKTEAEEGKPVSEYLYAELLTALRSHVPSKNWLQRDIKGLSFELQEINKWHLSSATKGLPNAQFALGRNMVYGAGCQTDIQSGMKWINAAATAGFSPAQHYIAQDLIAEAQGNITKAAGFWLENAAISDHYPAKLLLAWKLSTTREDEQRDGKRALHLLKSSNADDYVDDVRVLETKAAALAEVGQFERAVKEQKTAIKLAEELEWELPLMKERLYVYESKHAWRGQYYP